MHRMCDVVLYPYTCENISRDRDELFHNRTKFFQVYLLLDVRYSVRVAYTPEILKKKRCEQKHVKN